jgi:hypothetical protein
MSRIPNTDKYSENYPEFNGPYFFLFCQDACKRCCRRNLNSSCNAVAPVDILPDGTPCFQVQLTASVADPDPWDPYGFGPPRIRKFLDLLDPDPLV